MAKADAINQDKAAAAFIQQSIDKAAALMEAKREVLAELQMARDFLAFAVKNGSATPKQVAWIEENLPKRTRVGRDTDETTDAE